PRRPLGADPGRGAAAQPRVRDGASELRDVGVVHEPGDRAARAAPEPGQVREEGLHAAEAPRRAGGAAASGSPGREAHAAHPGAGRLHRRAGGRPVQAGSLPVLTCARRLGGAEAPDGRGCSPAATRHWKLDNTDKGQPPVLSMLVRLPPLRRYLVSSFWKSTAATLFVLFAFAAPAAAQAGGVRAGVSVDPDQFYFGGHYESAELVD